MPCTFTVSDIFDRQKYINKKLLRLAKNLFFNLKYKCSDNLQQQFIIRPAF